MTLPVTIACAGCAEKLSDRYILREIEECRGRCPWCGRVFGNISKYSYRTKTTFQRRQSRPQYKPRTGGGERNRKWDD